MVQGSPKISELVEIRMDLMESSLRQVENWSFRLKKRPGFRGFSRVQAVFKRVVFVCFHPHEIFCSESPCEARKFAAFCDCRMVSVVGGRDAEQQAK